MPECCEGAGSYQTPSAGSRTTLPSGLFAEKPDEPRDRFAKHIFGVFDDLNVAVAGNHAAASARKCGAVKADDGQVVSVPRGRDLISHADRWTRHFRHENA